MSYVDPGVEDPSGITMYVTIPATSNCATSTCNAEIAATGIDSLTAIAVGGLVLALGIILVARRQVMT